MAHHGGDVCCWVLLIVDGTFYYSYCRNSTGWEFFTPARKCFVTTPTQIGFKLLSCMARTTQPMSMAVYMMVGSNNDQKKFINVNMVVVASVQQGWCWKRAQKPTQPLHGREDALCVNMSHGLYQALREVAHKLITSFHHPLIIEGIVPTSNKASESWVFDNWP